MKYFAFVLISLSLFSCVSAKKYKDLLSQQEACNEELNKYKSMALDYEGKYKEFKEKYDVLIKDVDQLKKDTTRLGKELRDLKAEYEKIKEINEALDQKFKNLQQRGARENAVLTAELEAKNIELQRKEEELRQLEKELRGKEAALADREKRVQELEAMLKKQKDALRELKQKVLNALRGFEGKGITVEERDGKIYVSMEAKLLFASGSTSVDPEGKDAIIQLAKVLQEQSDLEIIVEGHTDTDPMKRSSHPKNNWELSVLRATAVVEIMLDNSEMKPQSISAAGRSEFHPVDENDKSKNRRIEVIISPNLDEVFKMLNEVE
ncbi:MAG: OmpA family protein [Crocinitomicaceae bacterium]